MISLKSTYKLFLILFLTLVGNRAYAQQPVVITGEAPFAKNEEIRLLIVDDLLHGVPTVVAHDKIDRNGHFKLTYPTTDIKLAQLAIRTSKAEFFIAPFQSYNFQISADTVLFNLINPERYGGFLHITTSKTDTADLNYKINKFSYYFSQVTDQYAFRLTYDHDKSAYDTVRQLLQSKFPIQYNPQNFYQSYLFYTFGLVEMLFDSRNIFHKYFDNDIIQYNNPAYIALFNDCFTGYLYNSRHISKELLSRTINENPDYLTLFNEAGRDPQLTNERLRELVIIKNLGEFMDNEEFDKGNIVKLLNYIKVSTHFPEHLPYINNLLELAKPSNVELTELVFKNEKNKNVHLNQLGDKDIYVQFFQSDCLDCIREMMLLKEFYKTFGDKIQFVSICLDADKKQYDQFIKTYGEMFEWPILFFNHNYDWLMHNGIETLPDYMMMNHEGAIIQRYTPSPENGLLEYFSRSYPDNVQEDNNPLFR